MKKIKVGLIGFGVIGSGVVKVLSENGDTIRERLGASIELVKIADLDIESDRGTPVEPSLLTTDAHQILEDPEIDIIIELIGGLEPAGAFILKALNNGKHAVTANKALLAKHGDEIFKVAEERHKCVGFEASVGGAIPIIRSIKEAFIANLLNAISRLVQGDNSRNLDRLKHTVILITFYPRKGMYDITIADGEAYPPTGHIITF